MKLFLDTATLDHIKDAVLWGIIDGVTTSPPKLKQALDTLRGTPDEMDMESYLKNILATAGRTRPVTLDLPGRTGEEMIEQGMQLYEVFNQVVGNVVISIPVCTPIGDNPGRWFDGITAIRRLDEERIPVNASMVFTPEQALLAAKAGADYVSPLAGAVDDRIRTSAGIAFEQSDYFPLEGITMPPDHTKGVEDRGLVSGVDLIDHIVTIFDEYELECEVLATSIRNPQQLREIALSGAHIATIPYDVLTAMIHHPGTAAGIDSCCDSLTGEYEALLNRTDTSGD